MPIIDLFSGLGIFARILVCKAGEEVKTARSRVFYALDVQKVVRPSYGHKKEKTYLFLFYVLVQDSSPVPTEGYLLFEEGDHLIIETATSFSTQSQNSLPEFKSVTVRSKEK